MHRESATSDGFSTVEESTPDRSITSKRKARSLVKTPARERSRTRRDEKLKTEPKEEINERIRWNDLYK